MSLRLASGAWHDIDLLRLRRQELGLELVRPVPTRDLLVRGGLIATGLVLSGGLILLGGLLYGQWLQRREQALQPVAQQYQELQSRLTTLRGQLNSLIKANQRLAGGVVSMASSSVVLAELSAVTPRDVQLRFVQQQGNQLVLKGDAPQPNALRLINAIQLELEESALFQADQVQLVKVLEKVSAQQSSGSSVAVVAPLSLEFELAAPFATLSARQRLDLLRRYGASGLLRRFESVAREGLLP